MSTGERMAEVERREFRLPNELRRLHDITLEAVSPRKGFVFGVMHVIVGCCGTMPSRYVT
jgi:hypothetical protein